MKKIGGETIWFRDARRLNTEAMQDSIRRKRGPGTGIWRGKPKMGPRKLKKRGTERGQKKLVPRPAPQSGAGRGFLTGPRKIRGPACPKANTTDNTRVWDNISLLILAVGRDGIVVSPITTSACSWFSSLVVPWRNGFRAPYFFFLAVRYGCGFSLFMPQACKQSDLSRLARDMN